MTERPEIVEDEHLEFLDDLRESGVTNMYGCAPYIQQEFYMLSIREAREIAVYWMHTFGKEDR